MDSLARGGGEFYWGERIGRRASREAFGGMGWETRTGGEESVPEGPTNGAEPPHRKAVPPSLQRRGARDYGIARIFRPPTPDL